MQKNSPPPDLSEVVSRALAEDIGSGDITAQLLPPARSVAATIVSKDHGMLCGVPWAETVFRQLDPQVKLNWHWDEGRIFEPGQVLARLEGPARAIMSGERTALNFLQTLSATATQTHRLVQLVSHTEVTLLDTRKTLPGLRTAQKYAVRTGGGKNHRLGLFDAFLIKENHIAACGGIAAAVAAAHRHCPDKPVELEVKSLSELTEALEAGADIVMLDNFEVAALTEAVNLAGGQVKLEASGGIDAENLVAIAETGIDYLSVGALTKNCRAIDLSLLVSDLSSRSCSPPGSVTDTR